MKLSVFAVLLQDRPFDEACRYLAEQGVQAVEIGCGGFPGKAHCDPVDLLAHPEKIDAFMATLRKYNLEIAALSTHGNPVHPDKAVAKAFHDDFENAVLLAEKLGVDTVVTFSGCPGGCPEDKTPNWVTCPWPDDFSEIVKRVKIFHPSVNPFIERHILVIQEINRRDYIFYKCKNS